VWGGNSYDRCDDRCSGVSTLAAQETEFYLSCDLQDVFVIPDGAPGALAELERRKFTAEEGVSENVAMTFSSPLMIMFGQDHLTLLNGKYPSHLSSSTLITDQNAAYNAFTRYGRSSGWCKSHALSFRAMSRAVSIRAQLKKYMQRFKLPLDSCEGDARRLRRCLVSGYWRNSARWTADGTYRSLRGGKVCDNTNTYWGGVKCVLNRSYTFIRLLLCSHANLGRVGWFSMRWKKRRKPCQSCKS